MEVTGELTRAASGGRVGTQMLEKVSADSSVKKFAYYGEEDGARGINLFMILDGRERDNKEEDTTVGSLEKVDGEEYRTKVSLFVLNKNIQKILSSKDELRLVRKNIALGAFPLNGLFLMKLQVVVSTENEGVGGTRAPGGSKGLVQPMRRRGAWRRQTDTVEVLSGQMLHQCPGCRVQGRRVVLD